MFAPDEVEIAGTGAIMSIAKGTHLGPYEIASQLEAGGMGEVYWARDTRPTAQLPSKFFPVT